MCGAQSQKKNADMLWAVRRELSPALKKISNIKLNNDVVVPRGRIPELFALVKDIQQESGLPIASFGHAGDGNIHVNIMIPETGTEEQRAERKSKGRSRSGACSKASWRWKAPSAGNMASDSRRRRTSASNCRRRRSPS